MPWPLIAAGVAAAGSLIGGERGNKAARKESKKNRAFQERMRNTQWQAGVADMEAAGINPALAYSQGGAASPGGSMAGQEDVISPAVNSAQEARRLDQELKNMKENARLLESQKYRTDQEGRESRSRELLNDMQRVGVNWNNELLRMNIPGARNISRFEAGKMGQGTRSIRTMLQSIFGSGGAFRAR